MISVQWFWIFHSSIILTCLTCTCTTKGLCTGTPMDLPFIVTIRSTMRLKASPSQWPEFSVRHCHLIMDVFSGTNCITAVHSGGYRPLEWPFMLSHSFSPPRGRSHRVHLRFSDEWNDTYDGAWIPWRASAVGKSKKACWMTNGTQPMPWGWGRDLSTQLLGKLKWRKEVHSWLVEGSCRSNEGIIHLMLLINI